MECRSIVCRYYHLHSREESIIYNPDLGGRTVNYVSLDVPGAVKEETDGLGDCTSVPREKISLAAWI